jgi:methylmalonyl-CoA mutase N-terminal domain/subunit
VANTVDPLAGSYFLESLTGEMEREAEDYFRRIRDLGGVIPAIECGFFQKEIGEAAYRYQRDLDLGRKTMVGVNRFVEEESAPIEILRIDPRPEREQARRLAALRRRRDAAGVSRALDRIREGARGTENLMPRIVDAVRAYATLGEMVQALRDVFGPYEESAVI